MFNFQLNNTQTTIMAHTWARLWYSNQLAHALEEQQPTDLSFARNGKIAHRVKEKETAK